MKYMKNTHTCPFNGAVVCDDQSSCDRCGWNPKVDEERRQRITQKNGGIPGEQEKKNLKKS